MNYIKKLESEIRFLNHRLNCAEYYTVALLDYVQSDKFQGEEGWGGDRYVHVNDITHRTELIKKSVRYGDPDLEFPKESYASST